MAPLSKLLAWAGVAMATPTYNYTTFPLVIESEYGLNSSPIVGGTFKISDMQMLPACDPLVNYRAAVKAPVKAVVDGDLSGVAISFSLIPVPETHWAPNVTLSGTLVLQTSAYQSSLTTATFPKLRMSIRQTLDLSTMYLDGPNCHPNGEDGQQVCAGTDAYGTNISATFQRMDAHNFYQILYIQYNAE